MKFNMTCCMPLLLAIVGNVACAANPDDSASAANIADKPKNIIVY
jgi:hypothetical protein